MTNYFGKARLKKIFYSYLSTDPEKEKAFKKSEKEQRAIAKEYGRCYTNEVMFHYSKLKGSKWLECGDDERRYKIWADGAKSKVVTIDEYIYNEESESELGYEKVCRIVSYYSEDFYPYPQNKNKKLDCYEIAKKAPADAELETVFITEDGKHCNFRKCKNDGWYDESAYCTEVKIALPKSFYIGVGSCDKVLHRKADGEQGFICVNHLGKLFIYCGKNGEHSAGITVVN